MKKTFLIPFLLGLLATGCSQDNSSKFTSSDSRSSTPQQKPKTETVAANTNSSASSSPIATAPSTADSKPIDVTGSAAASTPAPLTASPTSQETKEAITAAVASAANQSINPPTTSPAPDGVTTTAGPAAIASRMAEWRLTPADIKDEFEKTGRIERTKMPAPGAPTGPMDNAVIANLVNGKLGSDAVLGALRLTVEAKNGTVTLSGSAHGLDQIGRAMAFALDTEGVDRAVSLIKLDSAPQ